MCSDIEIVVGDVSDVEARIYARYHGSEGGERIVLRGSLRGPYCEKSHTLPAEFTFRDLGREIVEAEAVVTDPCMWSAELPHLYHIEVEAVQAGRVIAEYHGTVGLRRLSPRRPVDFAPGTG